MISSHNKLNLYHINEYNWLQFPILIPIRSLILFLKSAEEWLWISTDAIPRRIQITLDIGWAEYNHFRIESASVQQLGRQNWVKKEHSRKMEWNDFQ